MGQWQLPPSRAPPNSAAFSRALEGTGSRRTAVRRWGCSSTSGMSTRCPARMKSLFVRAGLFGGAGVRSLSPRSLRSASATKPSCYTPTQHRTVSSHPRSDGSRLVTAVVWPLTGCAISRRVRADDQSRAVGQMSSTSARPSTIQDQRERDESSAQPPPRTVGRRRWLARTIAVMRRVLRLRREPVESVSFVLARCFRHQIDPGFELIDGHELRFERRLDESDVVRSSRTAARDSTLAGVTRERYSAARHGNAQRASRNTGRPNGPRV